MKEFDMIDMNIKFYTQIINLNRKSVYSFVGVIVVSVALIMVNIFNETLLNKIAIGALGMNIIWFCMYLLDAMQELRQNKELLHRYKEQIHTKSGKKASCNMIMPKSITLG